MRATSAVIVTTFALVLGLVAAPPAQAEPAAVGAGTWENDSAAVTLSGTWAVKTSAQDSGGSFSQLTTVGYAQISFTTSSVKWTARKSGSSGIADVYLDGVKVQTVDLYSASTQYQQTVYEVSGLPETTHTLRIVRTGTKNPSSIGSNVSLDAFFTSNASPAPAANPAPTTPSPSPVAASTPTAPSPSPSATSATTSPTTSTPSPAPTTAAPTATTAAPTPTATPAATAAATPTTAPPAAPVAVAAVGAGTYENDSSAVTLSGDWSLKTSTMDSGGSYAQLTATGYAEISFATSGVKWIARKSASSGTADVYLDGVKVQTVDLFASTTQYQQTMYEVSGLAETPHTLRVVRTGLKNPNSIGSNVTLDAFVAPDIYPPATPTGLTATPESTGIRLSWTANTEPDLAGYRLYRANGTGWDNVADKITATTTLDADLQPGITYSYRLVALDAAGNESSRTSAVTATTTINAVGAGTYENDSPAVTLSGDWALKTSSQDSGGSYSQLTTAGYAQISFTTSGVKWIARTSSSSGTADVYLDGVKVQTVDLYSATTQYQQTVYEVSSLPETPHTLRIVRTGAKNSNSIGSNVTLDAFIAPDIYPPATPTGLTATPESTGIRLTWVANTEPDLAGYRVYRANGTEVTAIADTTDTSWMIPDLQPGTEYGYQLSALDGVGNESVRTDTARATVPLAAVGAGTYENDSTAVTLSGDWALRASTMDSGGSFSQLATAGYAQISFATSGIRWVARKSSSSGTADVYLDGAKVQTVDLYSATTQYQQTVYEVAGLSETPHTLRVVRTGAKNADSIGSSVTLDAFVAPDIYPPATPTGLTATPESTGIRLSWTANTESDLAGYRLYRANGSSWDNVADKVADTTTLDPDLQPGTAYSYRLVALDTAGNESPRTATVSATTAINAVGAGTYENDSAAVTLSGAWEPKTSSMDSGGSYAQLTTAGYAQISFTTSGVRWIARTSASSGTADVYLDGVKVQTVDLYSATTQYQQTVYEVSGLPETPHTLRVVRTGAKNADSIGSNVTLDAFVAPDIYPPATPTGLTATPESTGIRLTWTANTEPDLAEYRVYRANGTDVTAIADTTDTSWMIPDLQPGTEYGYQLSALDGVGNESVRTDTARATTPVAAVGAGTYENDSSAMTLSGSWSLKTSTMDSGGSYAQLTSTGYAQISFATSGIKWIARKSASSGTADVYLDGVKVQTVDLFASTTQYQQTVYEVSGLSETPHTLRIVRTGLKNPNSIGSNVTLDAFIAPDIYPPATPTGLTATPESTGVRLSWNANTERDLAGYRVYRASGSSWVKVADKVTDTTTLDADLQPGTAYRYRLVALDTAGNESPRTATVTATTTINAVGAGTYENDSPAVTLSGTWELKASPPDSGGSYSQLTTTGYAQISFTTSGIKWIARKSASSGTADVYLDGVKVQTVDLYAANTLFQQTVYEISGLPETPHTLRIVRTGNKNANSIGSNVTLDAFIAPDIYPPATPTGLTATPESTGIRLTWTANTEPDLAGYRLYRAEGTSTTWVQVQDAMISGTTLYDAGLDPSVTYRFRVRAVDTSANMSPTSSVVSRVPDPRPAITTLTEADCPTATVTATNATQLRTALANASPGDSIRLTADTTYNFSWYTLSRSGTAAQPIWICGPRSAVIDGGGPNDGRGLRIDGASYVNVVGFTMRNAAKGLQVRASSRIVASGLFVEQVGDEAIHLLNNTTDSVVVGNTINGTGRGENRAFYGEGVYIGTARENRCEYSGCQPDRSDRNVIAYNTITNTTSETIEVKAGSSGGRIFGNTVDGAAMGADHPAPIIVFGNDWVIEKNVIKNGVTDGLQIWTADYEPEFGLNNQIIGNTADNVPGLLARIGVLTRGNIVGCDNVPGQQGRANVSCQR